MDDRPLSVTSGHVFIATSVDGFVAREDHRLDWLTKQATGDEDYGYESFVESVDGLVMGRGSYENVRTFGEWPYRKDVVVLSRSLQQSDVPAELAGQVRISALDPVGVMQSLSEEGWTRAYVDGGRLIQSFLRCGLIEDLVLTTVPILIGEGIRLFGPLADDLDLELLSSTSFASGLVQSHYRVRADAAAHDEEGGSR